MKQVFSARFLCAVILLCLCYPAIVFAQATVPVRVSMRDDYARVVFGWDKSTPYKIENSGDGTLIIRFDKSDRLDLTEADVSKIANIFDLKIVSEDPLSVMLTIPRSSKVRDFNIGRRVVLDVYNPENADDLKNAKVAANTDKEEKPVPKEKIESPKKVEEKPLAAAVPPEIVLVPENLPERKSVKTDQQDTKKDDHKAETMKKPAMAPHQKKALDEAVRNDQHVVALLATNIVDVAAFVFLDELWMVMNDNSPYLIPGLSSGNKVMFGEMKKVPVEGGSAYRMRLPDDVHLKMQGSGGGLDWKVIMGDKVNEDDAIKPIRVGDDAAGAAAGKMLWPFKGASDPLSVHDDVTGENIYVVPVDNAQQLAGDERSYAEFDLLRSPIGLAILPKVDDLVVVKTTHGIEVSRPGGLSLLPNSRLDEARIFMERKRIEEAQKNDAHGDAHAGSHGDGGSAHGETDDPNALLKFNKWKMGSADELRKHMNVLLSGLHDKSEARKVEDLLTLGKMQLSHGRGAEALGFFEYARQELPALEKSPEFLILRGISQALDWKSEAALQDFLRVDTDKLEEAKYWKSYVLADLGDWEQAVKVLPDSYKPLHNYPPDIANRLSLVLAEVNLRDGKVNDAEELLTIVEHNSQEMSDPQVAYLKYLRGELYRQKGDKDRAKSIWEDLTQDKDDLYRTKAGLALAVLLDQEQKINNDQMIDRLERLRYAWRGDELEAQVKYWLGTAYFKNKNFIKGLAIMREGAAIANGTVLASRIAKDMADTFTNLYLSDDLKNVSALDALALYDQFSELTPVGSKGDKMVQMLAEHLVRSDLLGKASELLEYQVDHRLSGEEKMRVAIRLAAIRLLDKEPQKAVNSLAKAEKILARISDKDEQRARAHEIALLRVRAYLQNKQFETALSLVDKLPVGKDMHRLRADIAWQAGYWDEAADSLDNVLIDENLSPDRPLNEEQASLILNRAIALSLDNDYIALANMREKYLSLMAKSGHKANQFEVITRPRGSTALADRETLMSAVSEVDLFKDFLESYREEQK